MRLSLTGRSTHMPTKSSTRKRKKNTFSDGQGRLAAILLLPTMAVMGIVAGIPTVMTIREAFFKSSKKPDPHTGIIKHGETFVGWQNFTDMVTNAEHVLGNFGQMSEFWNDFVNTTLITVIAVFIETVLGVLMALIMAKSFRGRGIVRAGILVPWAIPTIVSALMWQLIFSDGGVMNKVLGHRVLWLADNVSSFWAIIIADVWKTAPFIGLLTLAGLQTISSEVYEAGKVDGASAWSQFWRITLPLVKPALVVAVLFRTLDTLRMFDLVWGLTGPGKYHTETLAVLINQEASQTRYGSAGAYSVVLVIYVLLVAYLFVKVLGADLASDPDRPQLSRKERRANRVRAKHAVAAITTSRAGTGTGE